MSEPGKDARITIVSGAPEAGPTAFIAALVSGGLALAIVVGGAGWIGYAQVTDPHRPDFNPLPLFFASCFALLAAFFLLRGVLHTLRYRKYGMSALDIGEARLGRTLRGVVRTERDIAPLSDFRVRLRCDLHASTRAIRGGGTGATHCLWESVQTVPVTARDAAGIPIEIAIPDDGVPSGTRQKGKDATERVTWALEVRAPLRGTDYYAEFPLVVSGPHRGGGQGSATLSAEPPARRRGQAGQAPSRSRRSLLPFLPLLIVGAFLSIAGTFTTWQQVHLTLHGLRATGHVLSVSPSVIDVAVDDRGPTPVTVHVLYGSNFHEWKPGRAVQFTCREVKEGTRSCRMDTGLERWINTLGTLGVGVALLGVAWLARPRKHTS